MKNGIFSNKSVNTLQTWRFMRKKFAVSFLEASQYYLLMQNFDPGSVCVSFMSMSCLPNHYAATKECLNNVNL